MQKCKPPEKVITMKLGQYQLQSMLEWHQGFISTNTVCFSLFLVFLEICICVTTAVGLIGCVKM